MPHHLPDEGDDSALTKLIENQLEEVDNKHMKPISCLDKESDSDFKELIEDQLETVGEDNPNQKNEMFQKLPDLNNPTCEIDEDITKLPQVAQLLQDFDRFESTVLQPNEIDDKQIKESSDFLDIGESSNRDLIEDMTTLPQVDGLLQDFDKFENRLLPPYDTDEIEMSEPSDWVDMGENLNLDDEDEFNENQYVTEEDWNFLVGGTDNDFMHNNFQGPMASGNLYGGRAANYGCAGGVCGWQGVVPSYIRYGFYVQVINGVKVWRWMGKRQKKYKRKGVPRVTLNPKKG